MALEKSGTNQTAENEDEEVKRYSVASTVDQEQPITVTLDERHIQHAVPTEERAGSSSLESSTVTVRMMDMGELEGWISRAKHRLAKYHTINTSDDLDAFGSFLEVWL